ncbi:hypothetical protein OESDEN_07216 [Oesophagostomum dentatum]|uniref:Serine aminopeptidase S33 domain-containing protein n=1 Tax=Oesophagostomum dentatum TaxID=61180 RepID=A0A0B1T5N1_OESDE|nr:hypothetical protein OESDEN_07216 [Oesophagostomum dentatum]
MACEHPNQDALLTGGRHKSENEGGTFISFLKGCVMCCYLMCPPTPNAITRKIAFHPPQKGHTYSICLEDGTNVSNASKLGGRKFFIKPQRLTKCSNSDYEELMRHVKVIIFAQPNASDLGEYLQPYNLNIPLLAELFETEVYAFDYSGFGFSSGRVSERNIYADIRTVFDYVRQRRPDKKVG